MNKLTVLTKHLTVLNLILLGVLAVVGLFVLEPLLDTSVQIPTVVPREAPAPKAQEKIPLLQDYLFISDMSLYYQEAWSRYLLRAVVDAAIAKGAAEGDEQPQSTVQETAPPLQDYLVIADQNLFHPERRIPALTAEVPRPEFVLYGTLITETVRIAYLIDKKAVRSTPGRGPRQNSLKIGETLSGYQLREVNHDHILMARGEDRFVVKVIAPGVKKERSATERTTAAGAADPMMGTVPQPAAAVAAPAAPRTGVSSTQPAPAAPPRTIIQRASPGRQSIPPIRRAPLTQ